MVGHSTLRVTLFEMFLDSLDYHVIPRRTLTARGMTVEDGVWGDIRVLGRVTDGVYEGL
jgi:hypothetical protein